MARIITALTASMAMVAITTTTDTASGESSFLWFVVAILVSGATFSLVFKLLGNEGFQGEVQRITRFAQHRFESVWDDPVAREELAESVENDLSVSVGLYDEQGRTLRVPGIDCDGPHNRIVVEGGELRLCITERDYGGPGKLVVALLMVSFLLMLISGKLARRLTKPLHAVTEVARAIGEGDLGARVRERFERGEVGVLSKAINEMADRIEKQLSDQKELLAAVSHEMRTPLGHVRILLELARDGDLDDKAVEELEREVEEMDRLVGELLARSRLDFDAIDRRPVDIVSVATRSLERVGLDPSLLNAPESLTMAADPTLLGRALTNLLENAERHGQGVVAVQVVASDEGGALIVVEDGGPGFDESAFEKFVRGTSEPIGPHRHPSLGLGLALSRRIAQAHQGSLRVQPREGGGARVLLEIRDLGKPSETTTQMSE